MLSQSETGGAFYLAYVNEVYNELAILEPQLAQILTDDWTIIRYAQAYTLCNVHVLPSVSQYADMSLSLSPTAPPPPDPTILAP